MKNLKILPIFLLLIMTFTTVCPVYADNTKALISTTSESVSSFTAGDVDELISAIDTENPDRKDVANAREAYESLSMADQIMVENYDLLVEAEKALDMDSGNTNQTSEDTASQKNGDSYTIRFSSYMPQVTLSIRFVTDEDGDSKMDAPNITVISPTNEIYEIGEKDSALQTSQCEIDVLRSDSYIQLDISRADDGIWTFKTSNRVIFESSDYKGNEEPATFSPSSENADGDRTDSKDKAGAPGGTNPIMLAVFAAVIVGVLILIKKMPTAGKKSGKKTPKNEPKTPVMDDDDDPISAADEIRKIKEEWEREKQKGLYKDYEDPSKAQAVEDDDRLDQTVVEVADESDIDDLDDGFFTGSRFKR